MAPAAIINEEGVLLSPDMLKRHPKNREPKNIEPLAENIYANGLLTPIRVTEGLFGGKHYIIAGERRWSAIKKLREEYPTDERFDLIPCILSKAETEFEIATEIIADNLDRENPDSEEFRRSVFALDQEYESASLVGNIDEKKTAFIKRVLSSKDLSDRQIRRYATIVSKSIPEIKQATENGIIPLKVAEEVSSLDEDSQRYIYGIIEDGGKVNSDLISQYKRYKAEAQVNGTKAMIYAGTVEELQKKLEEKSREIDEIKKNNKVIKPKPVKEAKEEPVKTLSLDRELIIKASKVRSIEKTASQLKSMGGTLITADLEKSVEKAINDLSQVLKKSREERNCKN